MTAPLVGVIGLLLGTVLFWAVVIKAIERAVIGGVGR